MGTDVYDCYCKLFKSTSRWQTFLRMFQTFADSASDDPLRASALEVWIQCRSPQYRTGSLARDQGIQLLTRDCLPWLQLIFAVWRVTDRSVSPVARRRPELYPALSRAAVATRNAIRRQHYKKGSQFQFIRLWRFVSFNIL